MASPIRLVAAGPAVSVPEAGFEHMALDRIRPRFLTFTAEQHQIEALDLLPPDPITVSPSDPQVVDLLFETPGDEPDLGFKYFIHGAAVLALITKPAYHPAIKAALAAVGTRVIQGAGLPELDGDLFGDVHCCLHAIMNNGEPISWRGLIAFMTGAYWLLSYIRDNNTPRGAWTPRTWTRELIETYAGLMYTPT